MISIDRGLLGKGQLGDVIERHIKYGQYVYQLDIIVFSNKNYDNYDLSNDVKSFPTKSKSKLWYCRDAVRIGKELFSKTTYDLIITQDPFLTGLAGYFLKKKFKARLLIHFHGDFWSNWRWLVEHPLNFIYWIISKLVVVKNADAIRVMSQGQKEKLIKAKISEKKIRVISTQINLNIFDKKDFFPEDKVKIVLHVGRPDPTKDYRTLMKAFRLTKKKFKDVAFIQCGGLDALAGLVGTNSQKLHRWLLKLVHKSSQNPNKGEKLKSVLNHYKDVDLGIIDKKLNLESYDKVTQDVLVTAYNLANVVILSSKSESFGKVLVEANACSKPVVSTATTGAKEIVQDGYNGFLVPIGDAKALAEKVLELLNNPELAKQMGENGRKLVQEKFSDNTEKIINLWQAICENKI